MSQQTMHSDAKILVGQTLSGAVDCSDKLVSGVYVPANFDGTAITFQAADRIDGTYFPVHDQSGATAYTLTTAASRYNSLPSEVFRGVKYLRALAGTAQVTDDTFLKFALVQNYAT